MARPTKYDDTAVEAILASLAHGATRTASAEAAGISYDSFKRWYDKKPDFKAAVKTAEAKAVLHRVEKIHQAIEGGLERRKVVTTRFEDEDGVRTTTVTTETFIDGNWTAAAWWLERRHWLDFGKRDMKAVDPAPTAEDTGKYLIDVDLDQI